MENSVLLLKNFFWKRHPKIRRYWYLEHEGKIILLRINNFPDEPMHTIINGLDIMDIDDGPPGWELEDLGKP